VDESLQQDEKDATSQALAKQIRAKNQSSKPLEYNIGTSPQIEIEDVTNVVEDEKIKEPLKVINKKQANASRNQNHKQKQTTNSAQTQLQTTIDYNSLF
jgi:hypothetical protein